VSLSRWVTIDQAAELTGLSRRAIEGRVERGTVESKVERGRRLIALVSLYERGLIPLSPGKTVGELLDRLERQAERIGELEAELHRREGGRGADAPRP
jgi:hypothetical protein